jgi:pimeloyl-ACP methyl ester carboxylesterase
MTLPPPGWFSAALATPAEEASVAVEGASIRYRAWGERGRGGAVLVHGTAAHAHWWDHVGPQLPAGLRVVALDLSGHGDSDRRGEYSLDRWAAEVVTVAADGGIAGAPVIIGHSLGGTIATRAAARYGAALAGIVVIDTPLFETPPEPEDTVMGSAAFRGERTYSSREEALARFRLVPEHPVLPYVRDHIAACSVTRLGNGQWGWKFDRGLFGKMAPSWPMVRPADCRAAILRAQHGIMTPAMAALLCERLGRDVTVFEIPAAGHHVLLDEPLCLVTALRAVLAGWALPSATATPDARLLSGVGDV